ALAPAALAAAEQEGLSGADREVFWGAYAQAELLGQALRQASARPGGLTRTNLLLSLWTLDVEHPAMPGVRVHTNGAATPSSWRAACSSSRTARRSRRCPPPTPTG
ncbi:MAG: hypothetical protein ACKVWR_14975, partial [Acidimicrobiales bacterium]